MPKAHRIKRQAIVVIHGIGEQRPMATLRAFAEAVLKIEKAPTDSMAWSKPDSISDGFEHHRLTISSSRSRPVTDVYELYWAHLFEQSSPSTFLTWARRLLFRPIFKLPSRFQIISVALWLALIIGLIIASWAWQALSTTWTVWTAALPIIGLIYGGILLAANRIFLGTISDAARYLDANPRNVEARNNVRRLGVGFLKRLHSSDRRYDRIIVCGHSLGSVIGYDILQRLWYEMHEDHAAPAKPSQRVQKQMSRRAAAKDGDGARKLHRDLWLEQIEMGNRWRISDFVTMGSPLAHADILMADSADEFRHAFRAGELSSCPPQIDPKSKRVGFKRKYQIAGGGIRELYLLRHTSMFAVMRWTNIYFETWRGIIGDPIGGPVAPRFGPGVRDLKVRTTGWRRFFSHLDYWRGEPPGLNGSAAPGTALEALKLALDIDLKIIAPSAADGVPKPPEK